jgi:DNA-binding transcriptional MerR regulator
MAQASAETPKRVWLKAAEVCAIAKVQSYVLRTWETEFPTLGVARTAGGPRAYRQVDVEQVLRIKQLVFGEGLTLAGARRRIDEERAAAKSELPFDDPLSDADPALSIEARARITEVKQGLRAILQLLSRAPGHGVHAAAPAIARPSGGNGHEKKASAAPAKRSAKPAKSAKKGR